MKRTTTELKNADRFIKLIQAFKRGASIQKKHNGRDWEDIDLGRYMDKSAVLYRVKTK